MVRFQVLTAASMNVTTFWDIAPRSFVEVDWYSMFAYCLHHQGDNLYGLMAFPLLDLYDFLTT
jgi:hypothetical protein